MTTTTEPGRSRASWIIGAALLVGAGAGLWLATQGGDEGNAPEEVAPAAATTRNPQDDPGAGDDGRVSAPAVMMGDSGRLSVELNALREGDTLVIGLGLPDEMRGEGPREVRVVDVAGRATDAEAWPIDGAGTGLRLELDPDWMRPGRYMIQVKTADKSPLALRRYVLEVTVDGQISE